MARIDMGSVIVVMFIIVVFLFVIIGMLTKCQYEIKYFLNESTIVSEESSTGGNTNAK